MYVIVGLPDEYTSESIIRAADYADNSILGDCVRAGLKHGTIIRKDITRGEMLKAMFPDTKTWIVDDYTVAVQFDDEIVAHLIDKKWFDTLWSKENIHET